MRRHDLVFKIYSTSDTLWTGATHKSLWLDKSARFFRWTLQWNRKEGGVTKRREDKNVFCVFYWMCDRVYKWWVGQFIKAIICLQDWWCWVHVRAISRSVESDDRRYLHFLYFHNLRWLRLVGWCLCSIKIYCTAIWVMVLGGRSMCL